MDTYDPEPIPEHSPPFERGNEAQIMQWADRTMAHYEHPTNHLSYSATSDRMHITDHATHLTASVDVGQRFTYSEAIGGLAAGPVDHGPEILARDHPQTVAEAATVQAAQRKLGVSVPQPGADFVNRRAAVAFNAPTVTDPVALAKLRHPSARYAATGPTTSVVHLPPRIGR